MSNQHSWSAVVRYRFSFDIRNPVISSFAKVRKTILIHWDFAISEKDALGWCDRRQRHPSTRSYGRLDCVLKGCASTCRFWCIGPVTKERDVNIPEVAATVRSLLAMVDEGELTAQTAMEGRMVRQLRGALVLFDALTRPRWLWGPSVQRNSDLVFRL